MLENVTAGVVGISKLKNNGNTIFEQKGIKLRNFDPEKFEEDIRKIYEISVQSFVNNFLYTEISFDEFYNKTLDIFKNEDIPDLYKIAILIISFILHSIV